MDCFENKDWIDKKWAGIKTLEQAQDLLKKDPEWQKTKALAISKLNSVSVGKLFHKALEHERKLSVTGRVPSSNSWLLVYPSVGAMLRCIDGKENIDVDGPKMVRLSIMETQKRYEHTVQYQTWIKHTETATFVATDCKFPENPSGLDAITLSLSVWWPP